MTVSLCGVLYGLLNFDGKVDVRKLYVQLNVTRSRLRCLRTCNCDCLFPCTVVILICIILCVLFILWNILVITDISVLLS